MRLRRTLSALAAATCLIVSVTACDPPAPAPPWRDSSAGVRNVDRGWFAPGSIWWGGFGDPHVVLHGDTYYAYASPVGGRMLPVLTSKDLRTWRVHQRWTTAGPPGTPGYSVANDAAIPAEIRGLVDNGTGVYNDTDWGRYNNNDAQVSFPRWGLAQHQGPWVKRTLWAPGVTRIGSTWYAYSAVRTSRTSDDPNGFGRFCLTAASAPSPTGPFRDISGAGPIQCQPVANDPAGSIDPAPFADTAAGKHYLLWKAAGKRALPGVTNPHPSALYAAQLGTNGKPIPGAAPVKLLQTNEGSWEGYTIENPAMVRYKGRYYLFYSGNYSGVIDGNGRSRYATGYAICPQGPRGACTRVDPRTPFLGSTNSEYGPGGATPFLDKAGNLRLAYAFFWPGENRGGNEDHAHPRRMNIATVTTNGAGHLQVQRQQWVAGQG